MLGPIRPYPHYLERHESNRLLVCLYYRLPTYLGTNFIWRTLLFFVFPHYLFHLLLPPILFPIFSSWSLKESHSFVAPVAQLLLFNASAAAVIDISERSNFFSLIFCIVCTIKCFRLRLTIIFKVFLFNAFYRPWNCWFIYVSLLCRTRKISCNDWLSLENYNIMYIGNGDRRSKYLIITFFISYHQNVQIDDSAHFLFFFHLSEWSRRLS